MAVWHHTAIVMATSSAQQPNILFIFADQQRWDTLGVNGSPMDLTPNLDRLSREGTRFQLPITNQPVCAPARACILTGQYATTHGVWKNGFGLTGEEVTLASCLGEAGYQTGYIGKWHLAPKEAGSGWVPPQHRGGFTDLWEASNVLEFTSQPFETVMFDGEGNEVRPPGYRVDAMTDRAIHFLRDGRDAARPFFLMISYLEPHHQNDVDRYVPPQGYEERYENPFVPQDLRPLPGNWAQQLPGYYGCIKSLDENVGRLMDTLAEVGVAENTIVVYTADHGCHFRTRNREYKRSCHDSSLRVPYVLWGPGFNRRQIVPEPVGLIDLAPALLSATGTLVPESMQGRSLLPLVERNTSGWQEETLVQISESGTGRAIRSERWTYCAMSAQTGSASAEVYDETHLYDNYADPFQHVNLVGRPQYEDVASQLRQRLVERMVQAGEAPAKIRPWSGQTPP